MKTATNMNLINKPEKFPLIKHKDKFTNCDITVAELAASIKQGHAFSVQFNNGSRRSKDFQAAGFLVVNVDEGMTIEEAQATDFYQRYASLMYTTISHTQEAHRFGVIFELEKPITTKHRLEKATTGLTMQFGGDKYCKDASSMYWGNTAAEIWLPGKTLPAKVVTELVARGTALRDAEDQNQFNALVWAALQTADKD